jgi:hypothetical protein
MQKGQMRANTALVNDRYLLPPSINSRGKELSLAALAGDLFLRHKHVVVTRNISIIQKELLRGNGLARKRWVNPEQSLFPYFLH